MNVELEVSDISIDELLDCTTIDIDVTVDTNDINLNILTNEAYSDIISPSHTILLDRDATDSHPATAISYKETNVWDALDSLEDSIGEFELLYTNENPTTATIGGIISGSTFNSKTMKEMWDLLLYPYQNPSFTSFSLLGVQPIMEVGEYIFVEKNYYWTTSNTGNVLSNSISISHDSYINTGISNDGNETIEDVAIKKIIPSTYTFTISGENTAGSSFSRNLSIQWKYKIFHGTTIGAPESSSSVRSLSASLFDTTSFSITISTTEYAICIPSYRTISMVRTSNYEDITDNFTMSYVNVYLADGTTIHSYKVYYLNTIFPLDLTATVILT